MERKEGRIAGVFTVELDVFGDDRGRFAEIFRREWFPGRAWDRLQVNRSHSRPGVLRGLHFHHLQADCWHCVAGSLRVGLYDLRRRSPTRGVGETLQLDGESFRSLFIPEARLIPTGRSPEGAHGYNVWSPGEYAEQAGAFLEQNGFFEREIARSEARFGPVVHAFSTYDSKRNADDPEPFARGINSIQLMHDGDRWYVVTIYWAGERPDLPIPGQYLPSGNGGGAP